MPKAQRAEPQPGRAASGGPPRDDAARPLPSVYAPFVDGAVAYDLVAHAIGAYAHATSSALSNAMSISREAVRFASDRVYKDVSAARTLSACRKPQDVLRAQTGFLDEAVRDYAGESTRMAGMVADAAQAAVRPLTDETEGLLRRVSLIPKHNGHFV